MDHNTFLRDVADVAPPPRLRALLMSLAGAGHTLMAPTERGDVHPLVVPLAREEGGAILGLLRWPTAPEGFPLPVVRHHVEVPARAFTLDLVAPSVDAALHRELAVRDALGTPISQALLDAVNDGGTLYAIGDQAASGLPIKAYLLVKVGETHAFFEELVVAHLDKGDTTAAKVTADRAVRVATGWGRPMGFRALLLDRLGERDEARDSAAAALADPIWTLGHAFERVAPLAGWTTLSSEGFRNLAAATCKPPADRAAHLLDALAVEGGRWSQERDTLAALYREAGLHSIAAFVLA